MSAAFKVSFISSIDLVESMGANLHITTGCDIVLFHDFLLCRPEMIQIEKNMTTFYDFSAFIRFIRLKNSAVETEIADYHLYRLRYDAVWVVLLSPIVI
jgi:hypothetical protein